MLFALALALPGLQACVTEVPLGTAPTPAELRADGDWIRAPAVRRSDVIAHLGRPWAADPDGRVDVFLLDRTQHNLLLFFTPYPVPLPGPGARHDAFTLIAYDADGSVLATDATFVTSGLFGVPAEGEPDHRPVARAGDFLFVHPGLGVDRAALAVTDARHFADARQRAATGVDGHFGACTLVPTCAPMADGVDGRVCWHRVAVDGEVLGYGVFLARWSTRAPGVPLDASEAAPQCHAAANLCSHALTLSVPIALAPGEHQVRFDNRHVGGSVEGTLTCAAGERWYAVLDGRVDARYSIAEQLTHGLDTAHASGTVVFSRTLPAGVVALPVLLDLGGKWLGGRAAPSPY